MRAVASVHGLSGRSRDCDVDVAVPIRDLTSGRVPQSLWNKISNKLVSMDPHPHIRLVHVNNDFRPAGQDLPSYG